jgi:deoxyguanosine kinase
MGDTLTDRQPRNLYCSLEGNIGSGKTSLGKTLSQKTGYLFYEEPLNDDIETFRKKFYADKNKYSFLFQIKIFLKRFKQHQQILNTNNNGIIQDRSIFFDKVFTYILYDTGNITDEELETYEDIWNTLKHQLMYPDIMIFLEVDTKILLDRIYKRNRPEENNITPEYLDLIKNKTEILYANMLQSGVSCFRFNWNDPNIHIPDIVHIIKQASQLQQSSWKLSR